jgi:hypothetical protein
VAFIDPNVDPRTRTVGVRVVIPNPDGVLRVGDYAKATIEAPLTRGGSPRQAVYDPELADKWISPRHPQVVASSPGACPICGVALVPAAEFGFTDEPGLEEEPLAVPRDAVLMAGENSVVYVETEPGRFEIRRVVLGPSLDDQIVVLRGVSEGEQVAVRGNFLIDSQMQLAGNPSLIDPNRFQPSLDESLSPEALAAIAKLPEPEASLAKAQRICPVTQFELGSMGTPKRVDVRGESVFICCDGCRERLFAEPDRYLAVLETSQSAGGAELHPPEMESPESGLPPIGPLEPLETQPDALRIEPIHSTHDDTDQIRNALARLPMSDRALAERQGICPVAEMTLGSMGTPIKVNVAGRPVFICCESCRQRLLAEPAKYLSKLPAENLR